jgi:hypothetical protein
MEVYPMTKHLSFLFVALLVITLTKSSFANETSATLAAKAVSENSTESATAIAELRALGPEGLQTLLEVNSQQINQYVANPTLSATPEWLRLTAALDAVSQQRNSYLSGLYWYTDLAEARKASVASSKPILSLRLLGRLTDELSCANSRFFRTVLYSNVEVSSALRDRFVLHWETVRPAPVITIDFGDGRKLVRTITGNSIHYILDSEGHLIDGLPGLYGPRAFMRGLDEAETIFKQIRDAKAEQKAVLLTSYYGTRINRISIDWLNDVKKIGGKEPEGVLIERDQDGNALAIAPLAVSKAMTEKTMLRAMMYTSEALGRTTDEEAWKKIAALHVDDSRLDQRSIGLIKKQTQDLPDGGKSLNYLLQNFQDSVALDTVRNEYRLHVKLYSWLAVDRRRTDLAALNEKVYAELFATPRSDPWLGLLQGDTYTGLDNGGVVKN